MIFSDVAQIALCFLLLSGFFYWVAAIFCVKDFFGVSPPKSEPSHYPSVSILKPLKGIDAELSSNIKTFCEQDYPDFELILGLNKPDGAELSEIKKTLEGVYCGKIKLALSNLDLGANEKVSNMQGMLNVSKGELILLSDSDMRVESDYLKTIVGEYQSSANIGMVTCLYKISAPDSCGTAFESMSIALDFLPSTLVARRFEGVSFGFGASMLFSAKTLDEIGGFPAVADYLADDYQIGARIYKKGYRILISKYVVENVVGNMSVMDYFNHQLRWARTVRASRAAGYFGSGISHIIPYAFLLNLTVGMNVFALSAFIFALLLRFCLAWIVYKKVIAEKAWLKWLVLLPLKDFLSFFIWIGAFTGSKVKWRGAKYEIQSDGKIIKI